MPNRFSTFISVRTLPLWTALLLGFAPNPSIAGELSKEERFLSIPYANSQVGTLQWGRAEASDRPWMIGVLTNSARYIDQVRLRALRALMRGNWPAESAVPVLVPMIHTTASSELRSEIASCLVMFGKEAVPLLVTELKTASDDYSTIGFVAIVLKNIGKDARPALPILKEFEKKMDADSNRETAAAGLGYSIFEAIQKIEPEYTWRGSLDNRIQMARVDVLEFDRRLTASAVPESIRSLRQLKSLYHAMGREYRTDLHEHLVKLSESPIALIAAATPYLGAILIGPDPEELKEFDNRAVMESVLKSRARTRFNDYPNETRVLAAKLLHRLGADAYPVLPCLQLAVRDKATTIRRLAVETLATMATTNQTAFAAMLPALTDWDSEISNFARQRLLEINPSQPDVLRRLTARKISSQYVVPVAGLFILFPLLQLLAVAGLAIALGSFSAGKPAQFPIKLIVSLLVMILVSEALRSFMKRPDGSGLPFTALNWLFWIAVTALWTRQYFKVTDSQTGFGGPSGIALQTMPTILLLWLLILFSPVLAILFGIAGESPAPAPPPGKMYIGARPLGFGTYFVVFLFFGTLFGLMALHDLQSKNNRFGKFLTLLNLILGITALLHHPVLMFRMLR